jgi:hypothetical protein
MKNLTDFPYFWRVRTRLPDRYGQPCKVLARGRLNSCLVEFQDGFRVVTSRNYLRKGKFGEIGYQKKEKKI